RAQALRRAALKPALFAELDKVFGGRPVSDENLRARLEKDGFTASAASTAARTYRETMELVSQHGGGYSDGGKPEDNVMPHQEPSQAKSSQPPTAMQTVFLMRLKDGPFIELRASAELTNGHAEAIKKLVDMALGVGH